MYAFCLGNRYEIGSCGVNQFFEPTALVPN
jgi:hypothetical protein